MPSPRAGVKLTVDDEVLARHPDIQVGAMLASELRAASPRLTEDPQPDLHQELGDRGLHLETLAAEPVIADWRAAIAACGLEPARHRSMPEQLARDTLKRGRVRTGVVLQDVSLDVATRHLAPLGAHDVERLPAADVRMRLAHPGRDTFTPLEGDDAEISLAGVVVYASGNEVIRWAFNARASQKTCLLAETDVALFVGEAVTTRQHGHLRAAFTELAGRLQRAGARVGPIAYLDAAQPAAEVSVG